jgi:hypothetical protein
MKKALSLLLFVLIALSMSMPLYAGELKMRNGFDVKGFVGDRGDFVEGTQNHFTQNLGLSGSYSTEPGFSINWNAEAATYGWGYSTGSEDKEFGWKALFAKWEAEKFNVTAGYLDPKVGNGMNFQVDSAMSGFIVDLKPTKATTISLLAMLTDENTSYTDSTGDITANVDAELLSDDGAEDAWTYGVELSQMIQGGNVNLYYMTAQDDSVTVGSKTAKRELNTVGASVHTNMSGIDLSAEAATFFGEYGDTDYTGMFATVGARTQVSDAVTVTANLYYAPGNDDDDDAVYEFNKRGMVQPLQQGLGRLDHDDDNLQLVAKQLSIFQITDDSGVYAAGLSADMKLAPKAALSAGIIYAMPDEKDADTSLNINGKDCPYQAWESMTKLNVGFGYEISKSLMFSLGASYITFSTDNTGDIEDLYGSTAYLAWSF